MSKVSDFLNSKIVKSDVGEETVLTWKETLSYALGRGAQGMNTSMTSSKYINFFLTDVLFKKLSNPMGVASKIRFFCGIFDAINDPMMGVLVDKTRTKDGQMRPYIKWAPLFVSLVMVLFFVGSANASPVFNIIYTTFLFVMLDVTYTAFDIPMGALAFSITPSGIERTKLFGVSSITRSVVGALPQVFVAGAALLPYFKDHTPQAYLTSAIISAVCIVVLTRLTYHNTRERAQHQSDTPSVKECFALLFKNRPLLMLFFANIFFLICKIPEQISFYFVADLLFNRKYNVFIDVIKFPLPARGYSRAQDSRKARQARGLAQILPDLLRLCNSAPSALRADHLRRSRQQARRSVRFDIHGYSCYSLYRSYHHPA